MEVDTIAAMVAVFAVAILFMTPFAWGPGRWPRRLRHQPE
jgi:hypothetical protein